MNYPNVKIYRPTVINYNVEIGEGTIIGPFCVISNNAKIGKNCHILYHVTICKDAVIGDNCFLGPKVTLLNDKHPPTKISEPPTIEDDVVIGAGCIIMPDVTIHEGARIGAGTLVTKDIPKDTLTYDRRDRVTW